LEKQIIIQKFGGTSIGSPENIPNIIKILSNNYNYKNIIVLSAFSKVTNLLEILVDSLQNQKFDKSIQTSQILKELHCNWVKKLNPIEYVKDKMFAQIDNYFEQIRSIIQGVSIVKELSKNVENRILAFGEMLSSSLFFIYLDSQNIYEVSYVSAFEIIHKINNEININNEILKEELQLNNIIITQGYVCIEDGKISNLGRGGSDYSAALIGASINAVKINIWTDVDGILTASPIIFKDVESLNQISYTQARELAKYGAKVLHLDTILPAITKNIEVRILNTWNLDFEGTIISNEKMTRKFAVSILENVLKYTISKNSEEKYLKKVGLVLSRLSTEGNELLEVISNIDNTEIYFKNNKLKTDDAIICLINPDISLIYNEINDYNYTYDSRNKIIKIFVSSINSKNLLNLIYKNLQKSLKV